MDIRACFCKTGPAIAAALFLIGSCIGFTVKYVLSAVVLPPFFDSGEALNRTLFFVDFYIPFLLSSLALYGCLFFTGFLGRGICLLVGLTGVVIAGYVLDDLFTIQLCMYSAYILVGAVAFAPPRNFYVSAISIVFFVVFLFHPPFLGPAMGGQVYSNPPIPDVAAIFFYMAAFATAMMSIRFLADKYAGSEDMVKHLNGVGAKMLLFNHRLQEYSKNSGEAAVKKDRLRFTSDLHDSCGYVFTNIIAISDAAMSWPSMEIQKTHEIFHLIQNQAREGLRRTRETLRMIREIQDPLSGSIDTLFEMKRIFEEVTEIRVDIETGNMKYDYGRAVNNVLTKIVQEAFTNSIRHGQASRILIHFWEFPDYLTLTVTDNGIGARQIVKGIGLAGMEERLAGVGGTLEAYSPEDGGFRIKVLIPMVNNVTAAEGLVPEPMGEDYAGT
jgi:signal transduction histidine kinase